MALVVVGVLVLVVVGVAVSQLGTSRGLSVPVSIDDLAVGILPPVCIKTGMPSDVLVEVEGNEPVFKPWWLLLLVLGPLGVLVMGVLWATATRPRVAGHVPVSSSALALVESAARLRRLGLTLGAAALVSSFLLLVGSAFVAALPAPLPAIVAGVAVVSLLGGAIAAGVARRRWIDVRLDVTGEWVLLGDVHPSFAAAVREQYATGRITG
jgi:hypothetical protein